MKIDENKKIVVEVKQELSTAEMVFRFVIFTIGAYLVLSALGIV